MEIWMYHTISGQLIRERFDEEHVQRMASMMKTRVYFFASLTTEEI